MLEQMQMRGFRTRLGTTPGTIVDGASMSSAGKALEILSSRAFFSQ